MAIRLSNRHSEYVDSKPPAGFRGAALLFERHAEKGPLFMGTALDKYADMKPQWDYPVVIESHINGIRTKEMNPNTPTSYEEIAEDAIRCWEAGAGAIHAHNTSFDLMGDDAYKD